MGATLPLKCRCGKIRGLVDPASPSVGRRVVCMCVDCQTFAHWLGNEAELLDEVGGTDVYQTTPARIRLTEGRDQIGCVRLSPKGTLRFYAKCCRTPLANMAASPGLAFAAIPHAFADHQTVPRDEAIGPVRLRIRAKGATGPAPTGSHREIKKLSLVGMAAGLLWDRVKGEHVPNPFRNDDGTPICEPEVLSKEERARIKAKCGPQ